MSTQTPFDLLEESRITAMLALQQFLHLRDGHPLLRVTSLNNCSTSTGDSDVIFAAIDFEYKYPTITEFGLSLLDSRDLSPDPAVTNYEKLIKTTHVSLGKPVRRFLFGITDYTQTKDTIADYITSSLRIPDCHSPKTLRNIVLVGHGIHAEFRLLKTYGVNILEVAPVVAILDTYYLSRDLFHRGFSLGELVGELFCRNLNLKPRGCHNAGNDACFTLNALLMLAMRSVGNLPPSWCSSNNGERIRKVMKVSYQNLGGIMNFGGLSAGWDLNQKIIHGWNVGVAAAVGVPGLVEVVATSEKSDPKKCEQVEKIMSDEEVQESSEANGSCSVCAQRKVREDEIAGTKTEAEDMLKFYRELLELETRFDVRCSKQEAKADTEVCVEKICNDDDNEHEEEGKEDIKDKEEVVLVISEPAAKPFSKKVKEIPGLDKFLRRFKKPEAGMKKVWRM